MSATRKTIVGVIFGGRSVEHDVSVVTGHQVMQAFNPAIYEVIPVYITRDGKWFTGDGLRDINHFKDGPIITRKDVQPVLLSPDVRHHGLIVNPLPGSFFQKPKILRLDVVFPAIHGSHGEDGTLQGLFELADIPYVGFATAGSALTNDKILTKQLLRQNGISVVEDVWFSRAEWRENPDAILACIKEKLDHPVFVKPATLGSSIGVGRADDDAMLRLRLDIAASFDRRILVEKAVTGGVEINCSVMGYAGDIQASVLEQPVSYDELLSFEDKYLRGGEGMKSAQRIIPAPISDELTGRIRQISLEAFKAVDGRGIARIDYLVKTETNEIYLNEMNTLPGSLAFYLWEPAGLPPAKLVDKLVTLAREAHADKRRNVYDYQTSLIEVAAGRGIKGAKGGAKMVSTRPASSPE